MQKHGVRSTHLIGLDRQAGMTPSCTQTAGGETPRFFIFFDSTQADVGCAVRTVDNVTVNGAHGASYNYVIFENVHDENSF